MKLPTPKLTMILSLTLGLVSIACQQHEAEPESEQKVLGDNVVEVIPLGDGAWQVVCRDNFRVNFNGNIQDLFAARDICTAYDGSSVSDFYSSIDGTTVSGKVLGEDEKRDLPIVRAEDFEDGVVDGKIDLDAKTDRVLLKNIDKEGALVVGGLEVVYGPLFIEGNSFSKITFSDLKMVHGPIYIDSNLNLESIVFDKLEFAELLSIGYGPGNTNKREMKFCAKQPMMLGGASAAFGETPNKTDIGMLNSGMHSGTTKIETIESLGIPYPTKSSIDKKEKLRVGISSFDDSIWTYSTPAGDGNCNYPPTSDNIPPPPMT